MTYFRDFNLGQFMNPISKNWVVYNSIVVMNDTHVVYRDRRVMASPELQSLPLA